MEYFDFNPTMFEKWNRLARMEHPIPGTHYHFQWLGLPRDYRAVAVSDFQLENEIVTFRELDRARVNSHVPFTPDDGVVFTQEHLKLAKPVRSMTPMFSNEKVC